MEGLQTVLQQADDDYLTGLANKGILKRAKKDLAEETPVLKWQGEEAHVTLTSETCVIRAPLGESSCSCPSSGICRHVMTAILWLKSQMDQGGEGRMDETGQSDEGTAGPVEEFLSVPLAQLKRACGSRRFGTFLGHAKFEELPELAETSTVTVTIPWEEATVRLLSPLEYSACTCHSRELCVHKAQALLIYQLKYGRISIKDLEASETPANTINIGMAKEAAEKVREHIGIQMNMGLSRQSPEVEDSMERLAIICHRAELAGFESRLREIASDYHQYFGRSAAFRSRQLLHKLLALYELAGRVLTAENVGELAPFAGSFRSDYEPVGRLRLTGMGARSFSSKTGYEGEIYYFLETGRKKWYTWTDARPVFYEGAGRRPEASKEAVGAPWGLPCKREQLPELEIELTSAKAAWGGRLSVSKETRGEILGPRNLDTDEIRQMCYDDYELLLEDYFGPRQNRSPDGLGGRRRERLSLIRAFGWETPSFDAVSQRFSWGLYDRRGRTIFVSLRYTKEEKLTITMLERLEQRLKRQEAKELLFFGAVYLEGGRLCLYPIEFFRQSESSGEASGSDDTLQVSGDGSYGTPAEILNSIGQYCQEVVSLLADLLVCGFSSVQDNVLATLSLLAEDGRRMGLSLAGEELTSIRNMLRNRRHQMEFQVDPVIEAMERLARYLMVCEEKISFDQARCAMRPDEDM